MKNLLNILIERNPELANIEIPSMEELKQKRVEHFNNSAGELDKQDGYNCTKCLNKGFKMRLDDLGNEVLQACSCQKIRSTLLRAKRSGLGDIIRDYTFDKFAATEPWQVDLLNKAKQFCHDDQAEWFYIGGQVGSGKTHLCTAIASHYIKQGKEVRYMLWAEDSKFLKANVNEDVYREKMNEYNNVEVLYIDDFLKTKQGEAPTTADINLAFEIINHRLISSGKITIISSEKLINELMDYDEGTMSRIYHKAKDYTFSIGRDRAKNYRLK